MKFMKATIYLSVIMGYIFNKEAFRALGMGLANS